MPRTQVSLFASLPEDYTAFRPVDREQECLNIRTDRNQWEWLSYNYRLRVVGNPPAWSCVIVVFTFLTVRITGRNLAEVAEAIAARRCDYLQEFHPEHWLQPKDTSAAFIGRIEVITTRAPEQVIGEATGQPEQAGA